MSDYLWDKTGEADPEVERLEELLGGLRFQPRTFEVPATLPFAPRRATPAPSQFSWARMAIAASLLVTLVLGTWVIMSKQQMVVKVGDANNVAHVSIPPSVPREKTMTQQEQAQEQQMLQELRRAMQNDRVTMARNEKHDKVERVGVPNVRRQERGATFVAARKRSDERPRHSNERDVNAQREEIARMTPQEKEAMEKFMLAMKVTSEKLGYAERQVAGLGHDSPQR